VRRSGAALLNDVAGNAPWPIGVTSVGIHERSSREKISHVTGMNVGGAAHVMNDEATRKYLQVHICMHSDCTGHPRMLNTVVELFLQTCG